MGIMKVTMRWAENSLCRSPAFPPHFPLIPLQEKFTCWPCVIGRGYKLSFNLPVRRQNSFPFLLLFPGRPSHDALATSVPHESDNLIHPVLGFVFIIIYSATDVFFFHHKVDFRFIVKLCKDNRCL